MRSITPLLLTIVFLFFVNPVDAQICNASGNVVIFSNYDGSGNTVATRLNINVDANIPNLKIGICSYERVTVNISGAFVGNVTRVIYAGMNSLNNHCGSVATTVITGVPAGIISYFTTPPATLADPNGNPSIICGTTCSNGPTGGCNTTNQIVHYFLTTFGAGSLLRSNFTQYGCWAGTTKTLSLATSGNCCLNPLPIDLLYFRSKCNTQGKRVFEWATAAETNNDYFTIERSADANNFEVIATIDGAGSSNQVLNYKWTEDATLAGTYYYRLKQTDYDGKFEIAGLISVNNNVGYDPIQLKLLNNPAENDLSFQLDTEENETLIVKVNDIYGRTVINKIYNISAGKNLFILDVNSIAKGIYILSVKTKDYSAQQKFVKK